MDEIYKNGVPLPEERQKERAQREPIAGITPVHISDEPPYSYANKELGGHVEVLARMYTRAQGSFGRDGFNPHERGVWDSRVSFIHLRDESARISPSYDFLITDALLRELKAAKNAKGADLSQDELLGICLAAGEDAVNPTFTTDAMNAINASYYASEIAFGESAKLATMFVENAPLNTAMGALIADNTTGETLRIKEISSGNNTGHWQKVMERIRGADDQKSVEITLTDFVEPTIAPELSNSGAMVNAEVYSLFDDMPVLPKENRFDTLISTYSFDSIWQPEDMRLEKIDNQWYQAKYRVKVADWASRREELISAMREQKPLNNAAATDYDGIVVERAMERVDVSEHPFYKYITGSEQKIVNLPGGLIKRIVNAFDSQLKEDGIFITGDVADFGETMISKMDADQCISGIAARYKVEDYALAKQILEAEYGLEVSFIGLPELVDGYLPNDWRDNCPENDWKQIDNLPSNKIMMVKRAKGQVDA